MNRFPAWRGSALFWVVGVSLLAAIGCRSALTTAMYLIRGTDVEPDYQGLKGKRVAVICRPLVSLQYRNANVAHELAQRITILLQQRVPKIKTIDQREVAKWLDENNWEEYVEVGRALDADMVLGIDLEGFNIFQGQTLYQGKANVTVRVYDCRDEGTVLYEKILPQVVYPPNSAVPTSERTEAQFRREFVSVLADRIARHFYSHDPYEDMALDATTL